MLGTLCDINDNIIDVTEWQGQLLTEFLQMSDVEVGEENKETLCGAD